MLYHIGCFGQFLQEYSQEHVGETGNDESRRRPSVNEKSSHINHPAYIAGSFNYALTSVDSLAHFRVSTVHGF